jgi:hypothetical protein
MKDGDPVSRSTASSLLVAIALTAGWAAGDKPAPQRTGPTIRLNREGSHAKAWFEVVGLSRADLDRLAKADLKPGQWEELFAVHVVTGQTAGKENQPAVLGSYRVEGGALRFEPRFPPVAGVKYGATFRPSRLPGRPGGGGEAVRAEFELPKSKPAVATVVRHVYPSRDRLPENQLKFYLHFSTPMSRGEAYRHIRLLDEAGKPVELPFLELDQELWDPEGKRFTLFFDPGRIKRGLKPREEVGPALVDGKRYVLVIDRGWLDAEGNPLKETYRKSFRVLAPDDTPPDPKTWKVEPPPADGTAPLTVRFGKPLDHALLQRLLWVVDQRGKQVTGTVGVTDEETRWHFTPERPWKAGRYELVVDTTLEDLAGNSVGRPFEVDRFRPIQREVKATTVRLPFEVKARLPK